MKDTDELTKDTRPNTSDRAWLENMRAQLLMLSQQLAAVRFKADLEQMLQANPALILGADVAFVTLLNPQTNTHSYFAGNNPNAISAMPLLRQPTWFNAASYDSDRTTGKHFPVVITNETEHNGVPGLLAALNVKTLIAAPLFKSNHLAAIFYLGWHHAQPFTSAEIVYINSMADQLALAIDNIIANEALAQKEHTNAVLLSLSNAIATIRNKADLYEVINQKLKDIIAFDHFVICLINDDGQTHSPYLYNRQSAFQNSPGVAPEAAASYSLDDGLCRQMMASTHPLIFDVDELMNLPDTPVWMGFWHQMGIKEMTSFALMDGDQCTGFFYLYAKQRNAVANENFALLKNIGLQISVAINNIRANEKIEAQLQEINAYKQQLEQETLYLKEHLNISYKPGEMVGSSTSLARVFHMIEQVARTSSTVLILGETGTGKELVARAIHNGSPRKDKLMIKVNCATLPAHLIESELFGHERGSFTGATERRTGKFELANNSTLFLDEVGELPPELQVKLLRALQEREIERIGGKGIIKVDVRIIAATNRNLYREVQAGNFRSDLYYRLNVFPITLPPLRERGDDIQELALYFVQQFSKKTGKSLKGISQQALKKLLNYSWPGNIRELEHLIERSVLLANGPVINDVLLPKVEQNEALSPPATESFTIKSLFNNERDYILAMLKFCNGKIAGPGGAAELLDIPPTTLNSKLKKFGIKRAHIID